MIRNIRTIAIRDAMQISKVPCRQSTNIDLMDLSQFLSALLAIIVIDIVLAGDNAIVIALAAETSRTPDHPGAGTQGHRRRGPRSWLPGEGLVRL